MKYNNDQMIIIRQVIVYEICMCTFACCKYVYSICYMSGSCYIIFGLFLFFQRYAFNKYKQVYDFYIGKRNTTPLK